MNLPNFIVNTNTTWKRLGETINFAIRLLDNVIDINKYVLPEIDRISHDNRRIGLGVMGLADYLFKKKIRYGSPQAIAETEKLMRFVRDTAYLASIELSKEKGSFPKFDTTLYSKAQFCKVVAGCNPHGNKMIME